MDETKGTELVELKPNNLTPEQKEKVDQLAAGINIER
jgi:hypothetical protein